MSERIIFFSRAIHLGEKRICLLYFASVNGMISIHKCLGIISLLNKYITKAYEKLRPICYVQVPQNLKEILSSVIISSASKLFLRKRFKYFAVLDSQK